MKNYNGFTSAQRNKAQSWLNKEWVSGRLTRPVACVACGQKEGVFDAHAEDYSEPFAAGKTDQFHLCYACHMMVHCRFRAPQQWEAYRSAVRSVTFAPFLTRNWPGFCSAFLEGSLNRRSVMRPIQARTALDDIHEWAQKFLSTPAGDVMATTSQGGAHDQRQPSFF